MSVFKFSEAKYYIFAIATLFGIIGLLSSCRMGKREKFIEYNNSLIKCFSNPEYYNKMKNNVKAAEELEKYLNNTKDSIAKSYDYNSYYEAELLFSDFPEDISIKKLKIRRDSIIERKLNDNVLIFQFELLKKSNPLHD